MRQLQTKRHPLLDALFKLNFIRTVDPASASLPPPPGGDGDAASLADAGSNSPFCVNPPDAPSTTTPSTATPSFPADQPPPLPLPPITPVPPSFEPSPPDNSSPGGPPGPGSTTPNSPQVGTNPPQVGTNPPQVGTNPPVGTVPPSPIVVVPSPPEPGTGGGGDGGPFQPPIVYPPPLAPPMQPGAGQPLWCVAKPTVPDPIMQEAMDYACGTGAECGSIQPTGACYQPNTVLAHASFAFNSYWQQSKAAGGTCDFGGTATIVTRDPSYEKCKFDLL
ncbi:hypothetical protein QOZ80_4AG0304340 [Eleusine coracana subsp. coracana]|nr:hypothetical protein QOZ80_4AG0304340 [Eleusine coracana subsp. coracana]